MKSIHYLFLALIFSVSSAFAGGKGWISDLDAGIAKAKKEGKSVLVEFTGSDWCPPCKMMQKNVFSKEEFVSKASKNYVLVIIDQPMKDKALSKKNEPLFAKYKVQSVPHVVLLNSSGKEFHRFNPTAAPSVDKFLKVIDPKNIKK